MSEDEIIERWPKQHHVVGPAPEPVIEQLIIDSDMKLPKEYLNLLRLSNGGYAELSLSPWTVDIWAAEDVTRLNSQYGVDSGTPNFLAFGSNLGEEVLVFDRREGQRSAVYMLPWHAPSERDAVKVVNSFKELIGAVCT